ncbi:MAG: hypothetical protein R3A52_00115 [Polyangiales bacterium]
MILSTVAFASACDDRGASPSATRVPTAPTAATALPPGPNTATDVDGAAGPSTTVTARLPRLPSLPAHADAGARPRPTRGFLGGDDAATLRRLCDAPVERIERNRGGSTVSFRVWFAGGERALFKPQQRADVANYRAELSAYRLSRLLGLDRVPPACGRLLPRATLQRAADLSGDAEFSQRVLTELLGRGDDVPGAMIDWVPGSLEPVPRADRYRELLDGSQPLAPEDATLAADLSALVLFDFITDNVDRWSGGNVLRQRAAAGAPPNPVLFMDNGASFSALHDGMGARPNDQAARLASVRRFSPRLVRRLRDLTEASLREAVGADPLGATLSDAQVRAVLARRDRVIAHVEAVTADAGGYVFP